MPPAPPAPPSRATALPASGGERKTKVGGWHSETGQLEFCGDAGRRLIRHMHEMADEATRRLLTELGPCQGRANLFLPPLVPSRFMQRPEPGLMILFPSCLPHMVYAHRGSRPRMPIAFDLRKELLL